MFSIQKSVLCKNALLLLILCFGPVTPQCATNDPFPNNINPTSVSLCTIGWSPCKQGSYKGDPQQVEQDIKIYCIKGCNQPFIRYYSNDPALVDIAPLNPVILLPGYTDDMTGWINVTANYVACARNTAVCSGDWSILSKYAYFNVIKDSMPRAATHFRKFVGNLVTNGAVLSQIHCVGHSLGAHLCGFIGKLFGARQLGHITGLDPAGPGYPQSNSSARLAPTDAILNDAVHTNPGGLGIAFDVCDADFWPNQKDGSVNPNQIQPKCNCETMAKQGGCSHYSSIYYWVTSIYYDFIGTKINRPPTGVASTEYSGFKYSGGIGEYNSTTNITYPY